MFIQTQSTPNPDSLKFSLDFLKAGLLPQGKQKDFPSPEAARGVPLAALLFEIDGVARVFFGHDFVTITKSSGEWKHIKPGVLVILMEYLVLHPSGHGPVLSWEALGGDGPAPLFEEGSIEERIRTILAVHVRPMVAKDGGDILFQSYDQGVVTLLMRGACAGCPSATRTLRLGVEKTLRHYVPEILEVRSATV